MPIFSSAMVMNKDNIKRKPGRPPKYNTEEERLHAANESLKRAKKKYYNKNMALLREYRNLKKIAASVGIEIGSPQL